MYPGGMCKNTWFTHTHTQIILCRKNCERLPSPIENGKEKCYFHQCELSLEQQSYIPSS